VEKRPIHNITHCLSVNSHRIPGAQGNTTICQVTFGYVVDFGTAWWFVVCTVQYETGRLQSAFWQALVILFLTWPGEPKSLRGCKIGRDCPM